MHKIPLEENEKTSIEHHRRLNPSIKDVVPKKVLKWLNAGFVYAISDSPWVSPVHVVPKKCGFTVIRNEKNELIPTRTDRIEGLHRLQKIEYCHQKGSLFFAFY